MLDLKKSTVYQIYPKSFYDTTGTGQGDINGITAKLDYLKELGVDYLWITPFFVSPQKDNGYDVADYLAVDKRYGTMADLERLIAEANSRDIGLMFDMVFNHTSTEHEWFQKALAGDKKYQDFYIFKDGPADQPPTNWESKFGGNAWEYVPSLKKWYLHLFDVTQADLNWDNPEVREALKDVLRFWKNKGIKGFRFDVINLVSKPAQFENDDQGDGRRFYTDGPHIHAYLKEMVQDAGIEDMMTVGEMSSTSIENCIRYSNPDEKELKMCFNFHHLKVDYKDGNKWALMPFDFMWLKKLFTQWQVGMQENNGWMATFWCNHDQPRIVSRLGNDEQYRVKSAKMLATSVHLLRGTPYIYQGEEIGMTNAKFTTIAQYKDVESINYYSILLAQGKSEAEALAILAERSRDNSRTPVQWDDSVHAGFTTGTPWISLIHNYPEINVQQAMQDNSSIWHYYRQLIALRKQYAVIAEGLYIPILEEHPSIFAFRRETETESCVVLLNYYDKPAQYQYDLTGYELLLSNDEQVSNGTLEAYQALVYYKAK